MVLFLSLPVPALHANQAGGGCHTRPIPPVVPLVAAAKGISFRRRPEAPFSPKGGESSLWFQLAHSGFMQGKYV